MIYGNPFHQFLEKSFFLKSMFLRLSKGEASISFKGELSEIKIAHQHKNTSTEQFYNKTILQSSSPFWVGLKLSTIFLIGTFFTPLFAQDDCDDILIVESREICPGNNYLLDVVLPIWDQYDIDQSGTFAPIAGVGTSIILEEDAMSDLLPIGFNFQFYDNVYSEFYISANGFITFTELHQQYAAGCCAGQIVPDPSVPNNLIAFAWEDLDPSILTGGGTIEYFTTGTSPNQILIVNFIDVEHYDDMFPATPDNSYLVTAQVQLHETSNRIEIHTTNMNGADLPGGDGGPHTMGIENANGTSGIAVPDRNQAAWDAVNDYVAFVPNGFGTCSQDVVWTNDQDATQLIGKTQTVNPLVTTEYTATMDCGFTCTKSVTIVVDATPPTAICQNATVQLDVPGVADIDFETALDFDGQDDYVLVPDNAGLQWMGEITVETWVKPAGLTGNHNVIATKLANGAEGFLLNVQSSDGHLRWLVGSSVNGVHGEVISTDPLPLNTWTHIAAVYDGSEIRLYLNGILDQQVAYAGGMDTFNGEDLMLGTCSQLPHLAHKFYGAIDELRIWDFAREEADIVRQMRQELPNEPEQPIAYWSFDDGTGSTVLTDDTGNGNEGALTNMDENTDWIPSVNVLNNGSFDVCGIVDITAIPDVFGEPETGDNVVVMVVTDVRGNTSSCSATVTVIDLVNPMAFCQNASTALDNEGNAAIEASDIDNGSTDFYGVTLIATPNTFTCNELGDNEVTLMVIDIRDNTTTCTANVAVLDLIVPTPKCQDLTVQLDADGGATIMPNEIDNGSSDNCAITLSVSPNTFGCSNVSGNVSTLSVEDEAGNIATCTSNIEVEDNVPPTPRCQGVVVELDENGETSIVPSDVDNDSSDACGIANLVVFPNTFECANLGDNSVELTVTDVNGNTASCGAIVTVEDNILPSLTCSADIRECTLDNFTFYDLPIAEDNCEVVNTYNIPPSGSQFGIGETVVTGYAVDVAGNTGTCTFLVSYLPLFVELEVSDYNGYGVSCANGADGFLTATPDGGFEPYTYQWSDGQTTQTATDLEQGFYSVIVTDGNSCTAFGSAFITGTPTLNCPILTKDITCFGAGDGEVSVAPSGGVGNYTVAWSGDNNVNSSAYQLQDLQAGNYTVMVTDANNCECTQTVTVHEPDELVLNTTNATIEVGSGGVTPFNYTTYTLDICGGAPPYELDWATEGYVRYAAAPSTNGCLTMNVLFTGEASWSVTVNDANGCANETTVISDDATGVPEIVETIVTAAEDCIEGDGAIDLVVEGGVPPYSFAWTGPDSWTAPQPGFGSSSVIGLPSGWYEVVVTDTGNPPNETHGWAWVACGSRGKNSLAKDGQNGILSVYPNPAIEQATVAFSLLENSQVKVKLLDITGRQVATIFEGVAEKGRLYQVPYAVAGLAEGIYMVLVESKNTSTVLFQQLVLISN